MSLDAKNENKEQQSAPRLPDVVIPSQTTNTESQDGTNERLTQSNSQSIEETNQENSQKEKSETQNSINTEEARQPDAKSDLKMTINSSPNEEVGSTSNFKSFTNSKSSNESEEAPSLSVAGLITNNASPSPISNTNNQPKVARATIIRHQSQPSQSIQQSPMIAHRSKSINASAIQNQTIAPVIPTLSNQPRKPLQPVPLIQLPPTSTTTSHVPPQIQQPPPQPALNVKIEQQPYINSNNPPSPSTESPYIQKSANYAKPIMPTSNVQYGQPYHQHPQPQPSQNIYNMYHFSPMANYYHFVQQPRQLQQQMQQNMTQMQIHGHHLHNGHPIQSINNMDTISVPAHQIPQVMPIQHPIPQMNRANSPKLHMNQLSTVTQIGVAIPPTQVPQPHQSTQQPTISVQMVQPGSDLQNQNKKVLIQNQPLPQPIVSRKPIQPPIVTPVKNEPDDEEMIPPEPTYYNDKETGEYGVRCVCGEGHIDSLLVQCEMCEFWLHGLCVNVARETKGESYFCPFCLKRKIRCKCKEPMKYSMPIIQCTKCKHWVHKQCENLDFGINPENFVCSFCGGGTYELKKVDFTDDDDDVADEEIIIDNEKRLAVANSIPEGNFKKMIIEDLNYSQINFRQFVAKYFHLFAPYLFDRAHEFWRVFNETLCTILNCKRSTLLNALDALAIHLLYKPYVASRQGRNSSRLTKSFSHSESITEFLEKNESWPRLEKQQTPVKIYCKDGRIHSPIELDDGAFITELPGFLMHTDEVKAENGIPLSCLIVTDSDVIIDTEGTTFTFAPLIRRSFHFNCIVKLIRIKGEPRIGLFATRMKGALSEEKSRRGPAIQADGELFLPFDGEIPYPVKKIEWKDKKRGKANVVNSKSSLPKSNSVELHSNKKDDINKETNNSSNYTTRYNTRSAARNGKRRSIDHSAFSNANSSSQNGRKSLSSINTSSVTNNANQSNSLLNQNFGSDMNLTLLSSFYDDSVPPMPFVILEDEDAVNKYKVKQEVRSRTRSSRGGRHRNND